MRRGSKGILLRGAVAAWMLGPSPAAATTLHVPAQHATLAGAVAAAVDGDRIEIDAAWNPAEPSVLVDVGVTVAGAGGTARLPSLVVGGGAEVILEDVSLVGSTESADTVPVGCVFGDASPVLCVNTAAVSGRDVRLAAVDHAGVAVVDGTLDLLRLDAIGLGAGPAVFAGAGAGVDLVDALFDGNALGALIVVGGSATLQGCTFRDNGDPARWERGVDLWVSAGDVTVLDGTFSSDAATGESLGAVYLEGASASFTTTSFEGYRGGRGAVLYAVPGDDGGALVLDRVTVIGAHASEGGGVAWLDHVETTVAGSVFTGLSSDGDAAGFQVSGGSIALVGVGASDLRTAGEGGFLRATDGADVRVDGAEITGTTHWVAADAGGAFSLHDSSLTWVNGWARDLWVTEEGAVVAAEGSTVHLEGVSLRNGLAGEEGGAVFVEGGSVVLDRVEATGSAATRGGVLWAEHALSVEVLESRFEGNVGLLDAGVMGLRGSAEGRVTGSRFCANDSGLGGAALSLSGLTAGVLDVQNNVFQDNVAGVGGTLFAMGGDEAPGGELSVVNNTFVGNFAPAGAVAVSDIPLSLWNNILMGSEVGVARAGTASMQGGYNLWNDNDLDATGAALPGNGAVLADPAFHRYVPGDCDSVLWLAAGSPARDAGDPGRLDPDGSRSDIGAYGGPLSTLADEDGDAWYADLDCADDEAGIYPGSTEVPYDGIDQDCDGADLCDVDGDGFDAWACEGPDCDDGAGAVNPDATEVWYDGVDQDCDGNDDDRDGDGFAAEEVGGSDCDDDDPDVHPGAEERTDDAIDQDCDGEAPRSFFSGGCGCAPPGTPGGGVSGLVVLGLVLGRRRSRKLRSPQSRLASGSG